MGWTNLAWRYLDSPEQLNSELDLGEVGVALDNAAYGVVAVPDAVKVVRHEVDPVCVFDKVGEIEPVVGSTVRQGTLLDDTVGAKKDRPSQVPV